MNTPNENISMAIFCDFENVALGVRDTKHQKFDIRPVLERLLLKGNIVVKKAYCDWERYKAFKASMHEANFELIEIPHVRMSGKNSADIRLVVDSLDFCYTKSHVNTFVIISGDSDFSPLVSKLRENNKKVIGVGVKQSTSDLLIANCDEFIFYDDLVRETQPQTESRRDQRGNAGNANQRRSPDEERLRKEELEKRRTKAVELVVETFDALVAERGDGGKIWASVVKDALKRRRPDFNESYFGFKTFGNVLDEAQSRGFFEVGREENASAYVFRSGARVTSAALDAADTSQASSRGARQTSSPAATKVSAPDTPPPSSSAVPPGSSPDTPPATSSDVSDEHRPKSTRRTRGGRRANGANRSEQQKNSVQSAESIENQETQTPANTMQAPATETHDDAVTVPPAHLVTAEHRADASAATGGKSRSRRSAGSRRQTEEPRVDVAHPQTEASRAGVAHAEAPPLDTAASVAPAEPTTTPAKRTRTRRASKKTAQPATMEQSDATDSAAALVPAPSAETPPPSEEPAPAKKSPRKTARKTARKTRKAESSED